MPVRVAVAIEAPAHAERLGLKYLVHLVDPAVAADAADAAIDVSTVVEVSEIG